MASMHTGARPGPAVGRLKAGFGFRAGRRVGRPALRLWAVLAGGALLAVGLAGMQLGSVDPARAESSSTQLLVASLLAPSQLLTKLRVRDEAGAEVTGVLRDLVIASHVAQSLKASPCGPLPSAQGEQGIDAALAEFKTSLPSATYAAVAAAVGQWQRQHAASAYDRILAELPIELAETAQCQVLHDIAADRLSRAASRWDEVKPRLGGAGL